MLAQTPVVKGRLTTHRKVRTGCGTCKVRHVKCDETKPHCFRCIKFGHKCVGYLKKPSQNQTKTLAVRPLVEPATLAPLRRQPQSPRFRSVDESLYFKIFCDNTAQHLAGPYDPVLWNRVILQASEAEASIRHAVIAIGALDMKIPTMRESKTRDVEQHCHAIPKTSTDQITLANKRNVFALQQYSEAVKSMREAIFSDTPDVRTALVASILIVCFETYHGNLASAGRQVYTATQMLEEWTATKAYRMSDPHKLSSPAPGTIEDELIYTFVRLDIQAMSNNADQYSLAEHFRLKDAAAGVLKSMPEVFTDITQARNYFNITARRVVHFGRLLEPVDPSRMEEKRPRMSYSDLLAAQKRYVAETERWMAAFLPLFVQTRNPKHRHYLAGATLRLNFLAVYTRLRHFLDDNEMGFDDEIENYREMVNLSKLFSGSNSSVFSFDIQIIWALDIVAMKCRNPLLRREAIRLLISKPRREGVLDSLLSAKVYIWLVGIEEDGMRDGIVPEESRVRNFGMKLDLVNRVANVSCEQPVKGSETGEVRKLQTKIRWRAEEEP